MTTESDTPVPARGSIGDVRTLDQLLVRRARLTPEAEAYRWFEPETGWRSLNWAEVAIRVGRWGEALRGLGLPAGSRVAILLPNGIDAVCADQANLALGLVSVPLHAIDNPASIAYILADSEASALVLGAPTQWAGIAAAGVPLPALQLVICSQGEAPAAVSSGPRLASLDTWLAAPAAAQTKEALPPAEEGLAAIVYTSGTTGRPKGVMLSHRNILSNVKAVLERFEVGPGDVFLSMLPLSHTFERTIGYYVPIAAGACVAYIRSIGQINEDLQAVRPTVLVSVPRIYERMYAALQQHAERAGPLQRHLLRLAEAVGWRRFCRGQGLSRGSRLAGLSDALLWPLLERLVATRLRAMLGGRLRVAVSGGAPLSSAVAHCFLGLGVPVLQGYGMTETSPVVAANTLDDNDPATVGRPVRGVEVRIGDNRELLVRGPSVMRGYWRRPEDTARASADGGWLHTGDQAELKNGRLRIIGRIKEIIVTSTGEKIAPGDLETAITSDPLFEQAFVTGDSRPFLTVFVVVNATQWKSFAATLGLGPEAANLDRPAVREAALARVRQLLRSFPVYAAPKALRLTLDKWTVENSLITPTLKLKRNGLEARFAASLREIYARGTARSAAGAQDTATPSSQPLP